MGSADKPPKKDFRAEHAADFLPQDVDVQFDPGTFSNSKAGAYLAELLSKESKKNRRLVSHILHKYFVGASHIEGIEDTRYRQSIFDLWKDFHIKAAQSYEQVSPLIRSLTINLIKARKLI